MSTIPCLALAIGLLSPSLALAQEASSSSPQTVNPHVRVDLHAAFERYGTLGFGARFEFPLAPNGIIDGNVRDELSLSVGADGFFFGSHNQWRGYGDAYIIPMALAQWNFYVGDWSLFPEAGIALHVQFGGDGWNDPYGHNRAWLYPALALGLGARYHFGPNVALLMRIGTPGGLQIGVVF